jgi:putative ABC transport system permease protein
MFKNYLTTAWRFLLKNRIFSLINIFGLTLGTACCIYILLYVSDQSDYDRHQVNAADIYRVTVRYNIRSKGTVENVATTAASAAPLIKKELGEVAQFTRVLPFAGIEQQLLQYKDKTLYEKDAVYVDSTFFDVFTYHFVRGRVADVLNKPYSVVLDRSVSDKLFGNEDPVGKTFTMTNADDGKINLTVTGIVDGTLGKSHLHAGIFVTMNSGNSGTYMMHEESWTRNTYMSSYIKLRHGADPGAVEKKLPALVEKYAGDNQEKAGIRMALYLQPIRSIHTTPGFIGIQFDKAVDPVFLKMLMIIAVLIQVIACINFMNLSTARASRRAKEVGVRKVIGAMRSHLVRQFLGESLLITLIGTALALPVLMIALPWLNSITHSNIVINMFDVRVMLLLVGLILFTGVLAGSYPAFYLSAFRAIRVIKGNFTSHISALGIRRGLVVVQFVMSIVLISGIVIIYSQLNYIKSKDLGFEKEQKLVFSMYSPEAVGRIPGFMTDLRMLPEVRFVSNSSQYLSRPYYFNNGFFLKGQKESESKGVEYIIPDEFFLRANGIHLVSGRDFWSTDSSKILINESYARMLGLDPAQAPGTMLYDVAHRSAEIVGVMKDFNYGSLHKQISGFVLWKRGPHDDPWPNITVSTNTANYKVLLSKIGELWHKDIPGVPFTFSFLDEMVQRQYEAEIAMSYIIDLFTIMAVVISGLGLFGLAAFNAEQRCKEIGIRKVLGASVGSIVRLLSGDFGRLVLVAFVISVPIAWWAMDRWLEGFAYRITIRWWMFVLAGLLSVAIAVVTISSQAIRAAIANPVKSLRST